MGQGARPAFSSPHGLCIGRHNDHGDRARLSGIAASPTDSASLPDGPWPRHSHATSSRQRHSVPFKSRESRSGSPSLRRQTSRASDSERSINIVRLIRPQDISGPRARPPLAMHQLAALRGSSGSRRVSQCPRMSGYRYLDLRLPRLRVQNFSGCACCTCGSARTLARRSGGARCRSRSARRHCRRVPHGRHGRWRC